MDKRDSVNKPVHGRFVILSVTTLAQLMAAIDATIVFLAVPSMGEYFRTSFSYMTIVVVAYIIATTAMLLPTGSIGQKYGRRKPFLLGFLVFSLSSLAIALSPDVFLVIIFRAIEGIGAGLMLTLAIPILLNAFPPHERGKAVGISSASWSVGALIGPLLGGALVSVAWQYIFLINVPIGFAGIFLGLKRIPKEEGHHDVSIRTVNVAVFLAFLVPLVIGIAFLNLYWLLASLAMLPVFVLTQRKKPLVPVELLKNRKYYPVVLVASLQGIGFMGILYVLSVFFQSDLGMSSVEAGLAIAPFPAASIIGTPLGGYLLDRTGKGGSLMAVSMMLQGLAIVFASFFLHNTVLLAVPLLAAGLGGSIFWSVSTTLGVDVAGDRYRNQASGTLFTVRNASLIIGFSLLAVFIGLFSPSQAASSLLIFGKNINIFSAVRNYIVFLGMLSLISSAVAFALRSKWDVHREAKSQKMEGAVKS